MAEGRPVGLFHLQPLSVGPQSEIEQESGLILLAGDQPNNILAQPLGDLLGFDIGHEAVLVRLADQISYGCSAHDKKGTEGKVNRR